MAASTKSSTKKKTTPKKKATSTKKITSTKKEAEPVKTDTPEEETIYELSPEESARRKKWIIGGAIVAIVLVGVFFTRNYLIVATVNGSPIWITDYFRLMYTRVGAESLNQLVTEELIIQEANKQGLVIPQEEIEAEIVTIQQNMQAQGQDFETAISDEGLDMNTLMRQIRIRKMIEAMVSSEVEVTDEEVQEYIAENEDSLPFLGDENADPEELVRKQLESQRQQTAMQEWMASLQEQANVKYSW